MRAVVLALCMAACGRSHWVSHYDTGVCPPVLRGTRSIVVGGRSDRVAVSADGRWAAYDGSPYYVGIEQRARLGSLHAADVVVRGGRPYVLVGAKPDPLHTETEQMRTGSMIAARSSVPPSS